MKRASETKITRYTVDGTKYFVDIITTPDTFDARLGHRDYGPTLYMFGVPKGPHARTERDFCQMVDANLPEYLAEYEETIF